jgi:hypothetical protein
LHIDHLANARWVSDLSAMDYTEDLMMLAGDVADTLSLLEWGLKSLAHKFKHVLFVPGNHDIWIMRERDTHDSLDKFQQVRDLADACGVSTKPFHCGPLSIVPLFGWYDYSFGTPNKRLNDIWMDFEACAWPKEFGLDDVTSFFIQLNEPALHIRNETVISFSHFLPRIDIMPNFVPHNRRILYPVLGTTLLEAHIRQLRPWMHVYGHSHVNQQTVIDGIAYLNNAFGYPSETWTAKTLIRVTEIDASAAKQ